MEAIGSCDDSPEVRALYAGRPWRIIELQWKYCGRYAVSQEQKAARQKQRKVTGAELLIRSCPTGAGPAH